MGYCVMQFKHLPGGIGALFFFGRCFNIVDHIYTPTRCNNNELNICDFVHHD